MLRTLTVAAVLAITATSASAQNTYIVTPSPFGAPITVNPGGILNPGDMSAPYRILEQSRLQQQQHLHEQQMQQRQFYYQQRLLQQQQQR